MKGLDEFRSFRAEVLEPLLVPIRAEVEAGKALMLKSFLWSLPVAAVVWLLALAVSRSLQTACVAGGVCLLLGLAVVAFQYSSMNSKRKAAFKSLVVSKIASFVDEELRYFPDSCVPEELFEASGVFTEGVDRYSGEDLVKGSYSGVELSFSEIHAEYKTTSTDSKGRTTTCWHTIFKGVMMIADFNKDFNTRTVVVPDSAESVFGSYIGNMLQKCNFSRSGSLVKLEDPDFEKAFAVYGDDQVEARYILTPSLMARIMELRSKFGNALALSFLGSKVFLFLPSSGNLFEVGDCLENPARLDNLFSSMASFAGVVDGLNLTARIWSKV